MKTRREVRRADLIEMHLKAAGLLLKPEDFGAEGFKVQARTLAEMDACERVANELKARYGIDLLVAL